MITTVNTAAALTSALKTAQAGDVIQLATGNYGVVSLANLKLTDVTIASSDPDAPAVLAGLNITSSTGITVRNVDFALGGDAVNVTSSQNIVLDGGEFHGTADKNLLNDPYAGVNIRNASNVTIRNSEFHDLVAGVQHQNSDHIVIENNQLHDIRMDGIRGGGSNWVTIRNNFFTDFYRNGAEHPDMIQFWTTATTSATHDITVSDNVFLRGQGTYVQGIFMGNEVSIPYENVTVTGNLIVGAQYHGLALLLAKDAVITGNTVVGMPDMPSWILLKNTTGTLLDGNVTSAWNLSNNAYAFKQATPSVAVATDGGAALYEAWKAAHAVVSAQLAGGGVQWAGGVGADNLHGGAAADSITGGAGDDTLYGGQGNDSVSGGDGANYLRGEDGDDSVIGGSRFDDLHGNAGNDTVRGGGGNDWVVGGKDQDQLFGDAGNDLVYGNLGDDTCEGGDGDDLIRGGQGGDLILGGAGVDWLSGDRGDDTLTGGDGADIFHSFGDAGLDRVTDFNAAAGDRVQLDPRTTYTTSQIGGDTVVALSGGGQVVLAGVQLASLPTGWIFIG